jgi:hypothetical protein
MWTYDQQTGLLLGSDGKGYPGGYSGHGLGVNNPAMQSTPDVGPIPQGFYTIGSPYVDPEKGPLVMALTPDPTNEMYGRGGFLMHGDLVTEIGLKLASLGCIVEPHATRLIVANSGDNRLQVIA